MSLLYTVKEVSSMSKVTVKTLHHYHNIGLLVPCEISEAGYRLYGAKELERLQQILLYRELDFTLEQIRRLLEENPDRSSMLTRQEELLVLRRRRLDTIIETLRKSIDSMERGERMDGPELFAGFGSEEEWKEALQEQNEHLKQQYDYDMLDSAPIDVRNMNEMAAEAAAFLSSAARSLRAGIKHSDREMMEIIRSHLAFLGAHGHPVTPADFAAQTRFFLDDEFHLRMLESQQTGVAYYLAAAAECYAAQA